MLIQREDAILLVIDLQTRLAPAIHGCDEVTRNHLRLIQGADALGVPCFVSEQYVDGLGPTLPEVKSAAVNARFFDKTHFSCAAEPGVVEMFAATGRHQIILTGTEAHVCVLQSALGLQQHGFNVFVVADAIGSRVPASRELAIERMRTCGIHVVTTEMVLFEWLGKACTDDFRRLLPLIK